MQVSCILSINLSKGYLNETMAFYAKKENSEAVSVLEKYEGFISFGFNCKYNK